MQPDSNSLADVLQNLLRAQELPTREVQVASLIDWVDQNDQPINQWGAEQPYYDTLRPRYMVPNGPLHAVTELAVIRGFDPDIVAVLRPWLTALPAVTTINVNTADPALLLAMAGENGEDFVGAVLGEAFVDAVLEARPFESLEAFHEQLTVALGIEEGEVATYWPESFLGVRSNYFELQMRVVLGEATIDVTSVLERRVGQAPEVVRRSLSRVPDVDMNALDEEQRQLLRHSCETTQVSSQGDFS